MDKLEIATKALREIIAGTEAACGDEYTLAYAAKESWKIAREALFQLDSLSRESRWTLVEVGNWYTEYQCQACREFGVISDDDIIGIFTANLICKCTSENHEPGTE